jgi:phosphatidate cytidylyltransferase
MGLGALAEHPDDRLQEEDEFAPPRRRGGRRPPRDHEEPPPAAGGLEGAPPYGEYEGFDGNYEVEEHGPSRDLVPRLVTAGIVAAIALVAFAVGRGAATVLVTAVAAICALELYTSFQRSGYHPATLVGVLGTAAVVPLAYDTGESGILIGLILVIAFTFFWYLFEVVHARPTVNFGLTLLPFAWVGIFAAYAGLLLSVPVSGTGLLLGVVICAVGSDVVAFFVGRSMGRTALLPRVSPNKTVEGLVAGAVTAGVLGGLVGSVLHTRASAPASCSASSWPSPPRSAIWSNR